MSSPIVDITPRIAADIAARMAADSRALHTMMTTAPPDELVPSAVDLADLLARVTALMHTMAVELDTRRASDAPAPPMRP